MLDVTVDTNIYISGFEFGGLPRQLLELARTGAFRLNISDAIQQEVVRVLRAKFKYTPERLLETTTRMRKLAQYVTPAIVIDVIKADPPDNRILECAVTAKSAFIVSGDTRHLLPLGSFAGIPIIKVATFLEIWNRSGS